MMPLAPVLFSTSQRLRRFAKVWSEMWCALCRLRRHSAHHISLRRKPPQVARIRE